jgi:hypothetical protein
MKTYQDIQNIQELLRSNKEKIAVKISNKTLSIIGYSCNHGRSILYQIETMLYSINY